MASLSAQRAGSSLPLSLSSPLRLALRARTPSTILASTPHRTPTRALSTRPALYSPTAYTRPPAAAAAPAPAAKPAPTTERPPTTARNDAASAAQAPPIQDIVRSGLSDGPATPAAGGDAPTDWTTSYSGLSAEAFPAEVAGVLLAPLAPDDVEVKPDGILYLPEIKYRRILNRAFGPGGWGLAPRGETIVTSKTVTREYALLAHGRLISISRGEQAYFDPEGIPTATEGCKSNALMRCCKDLGVASELWDPRFIRSFMREHAREVWAEHAVTKRRRRVALRRDDELRYPYKECKAPSA